MTNVNQHFSSNTPIRGAAMAAAVLLILVGIAFQAGELGYGHFDPRSFWLFSMIGAGIWNMLACRMDAPSAHEMLGYWPLAIAGLGLAILLTTRSASRLRASMTSRAGERHDEQ